MTMTETEIKIISGALESANPQYEVNKACREILSLRLQWDKQPDRRLRFLLEDIVMKMEFPLQYAVDRKEVGLYRDLIDLSDRRELLGYAGAAVTGLLAVTARNSFVRFLGGSLAALGGYGVCKTLANAAMEKTRLVVISTPEEIGEEVDKAYEALTALYDYRQLEGRNIRILTWFQKLYSNEVSDEMKVDISRLLDQFGYKFVEFSPERSADFEASSGNVEKPLTTQPAIINEAGSAVCKGMVVLPKLANS